MAEKPVPTGSAGEKPFPGPKRKWPAANRARAGCYFRRMPTASPPALLVYTQTAGFRHGSIPKAVAAIRKLGRERGFAVVATEDPGRIRPDFLEAFDALAFVNTSGNILDAEGRRAVRAFVEAGGGFAGIHAACDTGYDWPWYGALVGAWFGSSG